MFGQMPGFFVFMEKRWKFIFASLNAHGINKTNRKIVPYYRICMVQLKQMLQIVSVVSSTGDISSVSSFSIFIFKLKTRDFFSFQDTTATNREEKKSTQ